jgi:hypothetical protein
LLWRISFITTGKKSSSRLSGGLCCCVSFWFWQKISFVIWFRQEIVFGFTYVLSVQYSCAFVSVFLLWRESYITSGKKSSSCLSGGLCCCVSFWFWRDIGSFFVVAGKFHYTWKKKFESSVWRVVLLCQLKVLLRLGKKRSSRLSGGLCCCVSFRFWWEIGFGCTYYYVLGVPYSCSVVLVFLVLAGNSFWCYVRT